MLGQVFQSCVLSLAVLGLRRSLARMKLFSPRITPWLSILCAIITYSVATAQDVRFIPATPENNGDAGIKVTLRLLAQTEKDLILGMQTSDYYEWKHPSRNAHHLPILWKISK